MLSKVHHFSKDVTVTAKNTFSDEYYLKEGCIRNYNADGLEECHAFRLFGRVEDAIRRDRV
jgi:hypothetical protein